MKNGYRVIDCDLHVMEPLNIWDRYADDAFKGNTPMLHEGRLMPPAFVETAVSRMEMSSADRGRRLAKARAEARFDKARAAGFDPLSQLEAMDVEGIDIGVLFHTIQLALTAYDGIAPVLAGGLCRAANRWLTEFASANGSRLKATGHVPFHDIEVTLAEAAYAIDELGVIAVVSTTQPCEGRPLHDPYYHPLWELLTDRGIPIAFHGMSVNRSQVHISQRFPDNHALQHGAGHPIEMMMIVGSLTLGGILERYPRLRFGCMESTCGWLPWWLHRLDEEYEKFGDNLDLEPSAPPTEQFKANGIIATDVDEPFIGHFVERFGDDHLVVSTDYPHDDSLYPIAIDTFLEKNETSLSGQTKAKILGANSARFYGLD